MVAYKAEFYTELRNPFLIKIKWGTPVTEKSQFAPNSIDA